MTQSKAKPRAASQTVPVEFRVTGMTCSSCVARVEKNLKNLPGVSTASVNLATERAKIVFAANPLAQKAITESLIRIGFGTEFPDALVKINPEVELERQKIKVGIAALLTLPLMLPMFLMLFKTHTAFHLSPWLQLVFALPLQIYCGAPFYKSAWKAVRDRAGNMDLLVALGTSAAFLLSVYHFTRSPWIDDPQYPLYFESAAVIITLVMLGKYWEARAKFQATRAIRDLEGLRPDKVSIREDGKEQSIPLSRLRLGDTLIIKPGERIAADAVILEGSTFVDESMLTGESVPAEKNPKDRITGGTLNGDGVIYARVDALGSETILSKMIRLIEDAQAEKPAVQHLVDRISAVFVPIVLGFALLTFIGWMISTGSMQASIIHAVAVLVIACPCALGLATPTAIMVGTGMAAKAGILIRDPEAIEEASQIKSLVFDKTGTLTEGRMIIKQIEAFGTTKEALIKDCVAIQLGSEHPLAKALVAAHPHAAERGEDIRALPGRGIKGRVDGRTLIIGNKALMKDFDVPLDNPSLLRSIESHQGSTLSFVAELKTQKVIGLIAFDDSIKETAKVTIEQLHSHGIQTLVLSGDNAATVRRVARTLGISDWLAEVNPEEKLQAVKTLQSKGQKVGMVGDGINDAPALAAADLSIAMGTGTDVAMQTASITILRGDLRLVYDSIRLCRSILLKIKQNLFWAFLYNAIGIPLAAFGYLNPMVAAGAMALSSVSVVGNSLLLRLWRPSH